MAEELKKMGDNMKKKNPKRVMQLERYLSDTRIIMAIIIGIDLFFFMVMNFVINTLIAIPEMFKDLDNPGKYVGLKNVLPNINNIRTYGGIYIPIFIILLIFLLALDACTAYKMKVAWSEEYFNIGQKGDERWTTDEEIKQQFLEIPDKNESFPGYGGTIVSRMGNKLYIDTSPVNNMIIGITRSGKGEMYVFPSIDVYSRAEKKASLVINDMKLELYKSSKKTLENRGYKVYLLNFDDPIHSMGFNPLTVIIELAVNGDYENAELLAQAFAFSIFNPDEPANTDRFWNDASSSLLAALILAHLEDCLRMDEMDNDRRYKIWTEKRVAYDGLDDDLKEKADKLYEEELNKNEKSDIILNPAVMYLPEDAGYEKIYDNVKKINMYSIINTFTELARIRNPENPDITALDIYFSKRPQLDRAKLKYAAIEIAGDKPKSSIFGVMLSRLTTFTYESMAKMTAESSFDLEEIGFGEKPVAVFLGLPDYDTSKHFLATVFIRQVSLVLSKRANRDRSGKCKRLVKFIVDEAGNMPAIEGLETYITMNLGRNISYDFYIQSYSQFEKKYGEGWKTIKGNCGNQIYILTSDGDTAQTFSEDLGNETIVDLQRTGEKLSTHKHFMENTQEKPLLNKNQLMRLNEGECVVKRVMSRKDLNGNRVEPTPIFNSEESGKRFKYRYEYLTETFPNPGDIDLYEINTADRSHINLRERVWDYNISMTWLSNDVMDYGRDSLKVRDLSNGNDVMSALERIMEVTDLRNINEEMELSELTDLIYKRIDKKDERDAILSLVKIGSETGNE
ncbi:type IV secretory system conjugative DNA transfer family protein [Lachnospiraceae bacterium NSJ-171]|nr:type IV secretory system conjugative DNA transfer family protein [Lachnospiraceae bacterium NSJ-171]